MKRLLIVGAGLIVGLGIRYIVFPTIQRLAGEVTLPGKIPPFPGLPSPSTDPWDWFVITPDNRIQLYSPKIEVGQGIHTLLAQLAAEELEVSLDQICVHQPDTNRGLPIMVNVTGGSASVKMTQQELRTAAATLREMLRRTAAQRWHCPLSDVLLEHGYCVRRNAPAQRLSYAELASDRRMLPTLADPPHLKAMADFKVVGHPLPRVDLPAKVTGKAIYGPDVRLPGMLYGAIAHPPREGATLTSVTGVERAQRWPGVVAVVHEAGFVGIAARRRRQAIEALEQLELTWNGGTNLSQDDLLAQVRTTAHEGAVVFAEGKPSPHQPGEQVLAAEYRTHMCVPLPFESPVTTADVRAEGATLYTAVQSTHFVRNQVAKALKLRPEQVRVIVTTVGSSFARKHGAVGEPSVEAARLSRAAGQPVQVAYTMAEDFRYGVKRPPTYSLLRARVYPDGQIATFEHSLASSAGASVFPPQDKVPKFTGVDMSSIMGSQPFYSLMQHRKVYYKHIDLPILTSTFRSPGLTSNVFAVESFMDELAICAGVDPLAFRLRHLGPDSMNQRLKAVLETVAQDANWQNNPQTAQGIACYAYGQAVAAMVADVIADGDRVLLKRLTIVAEAGRLVNPDVSASQVEGAVLMGLSWATTEVLEIANGLVRTDNLEDYQLLKPSDAPGVRVHLLQGETFLSGLNEIAAGLVAPALGNAIYALTGERHRTSPIRLFDSEEKQYSSK